MKTFFAVYLGSERPVKNWHEMDEDTRKQKEKAGIEAWAKWGNDNKNSIIDVGCPIGKTKMVNDKGVADTKNEITGYTIVRAESHEAAARLFLNHPHFSIFPGDRVEIMECLQLPEM